MAIISKIIRLLYKHLVFVYLIPKLLVWFAACDKVISLLLIIIGQLLIGVLALVKVFYVAPPRLGLERILIGLLLTGSSMSCSS